MDSKKKITVSWSGGKDCAFALYKILLSEEYEVIHLHTVISEQTKRVGLHGIREELIERQAAALGIRLIKLYLKDSDDNRGYENLMKSFYKKCADEKLEGVVFGDIFLEDLKEFRERLLDAAGIPGIFPLWKIESKTLVEDFLQTGFKTLVCAANEKYFSQEDLGMTIDHQFMKLLPLSVDPCGENGEFHTFVYNGPLFKESIKIQYGNVIRKTYTYNIQTENGIEVQKTDFLFKELNVI